MDYMEVDYVAGVVLDSPEPNVTFKMHVSQIQAKAQRYFIDIK